MTAEQLNGRLVWITARHGVNPDNVVSVFHGAGGQLDIHLVHAEAIHTFEKDLTPDGRLFLLPAQPTAPG